MMKKFLSDYWHHLKWHLLVYPMLLAGAYIWNLTFDKKTGIEGLYAV